MEMGTLERQLDELEQRGVELEQRLRECSNGEVYCSELGEFFI